MEAGAPTALDHATRIWQEKLTAFSPPPLDAGIAARLQTFVLERKSQPSL